MNRAYLIHELNHLKVETGSLVCLGCQHEDNCGIKGCTLIREAVAELEVLREVEGWLKERMNKQTIKDKTKR